MRTGLATSAVIFILASVFSPALADTMFSYVGNNFSYCDDLNTGINSNCKGSRITGSFVTTLSGGALVNLSNIFIEDTARIHDVTSFSFSDGLGLTLDQSNTDSVAFLISTDAAGNLTKWVVIVQQAYGAVPYQNDLEILSAPSAGVGTDLSHHCFALGPLCTDNFEVFESFPQGEWTRQTVVPEPSAISLFGMGLMMLAVFAGGFSGSARTRI